MNRKEWIRMKAEESVNDWDEFNSNTLRKIQDKVKEESTETDLKIIGLYENISRTIIDAIKDKIVLNKEPLNINNNTIVCFDRDLTTSTGVPKGPVEINQIEEIKDESFLTIAIGNQLLKKEAEIPGRYEIDQASNNKDNYKETIKNSLNLSAQSSTPKDETLRKLAIMFPEKTIYVIDDKDLSHVKEVKYYEPYEFYLMY